MDPIANVYALKYTLSRSYFQLLAVYGETKSLDMCVQCSPLSAWAVSTPFYALLLRSTVMAGGRGLFMPTFLQRLIENNMWKLESPARQRAAVCIVWREDSSFRPVDATKNKPPQMSAGRAESQGDLRTRTFEWTWRSTVKLLFFFNEVRLKLGNFRVLKGKRFLY